MEFLTARQAAAELGITAATLYAYVSRGLIRSEAVPGSRARQYRREDVLAFRQRKEVRADPGRAAAGVLHWGVPVLESAITLITGGRLFYRGLSATDLACARDFEEVAALLWSGTLGLMPAAPSAPATAGRLAAVAERLGPVSAFERLQILLPLAGTLDPAAYDLRPGALQLTAARILRLVAAVAAGDPEKAAGRGAAGDPAEAAGRSAAGDSGRATGLGATGRGAAGRSAADLLAGAHGLTDRPARDLLNAALVLTADHELNVSAFAARCVASAGATPYAVVSAGLAALQGGKHGGHCDRVEALFEEAAAAKDAAACLAARLRRGEDIPGTSPPLYPEGDPRGRLLVDLATAVRPRSPQVALAHALEEGMRELLGERPSVDFGLVTAARALGLPPGSAIALFAVGRTAGWLGHAIEQYGLDRMIRPRARYVGPTPEC
ncbi:MAG: citrate synthase family protein [Candidatus Sericytochromatia bacterium]|nr:citrate synthase family protein [Candidatus Tanganyikabacteria bacterium]